MTNKFFKGVTDKIPGDVKRFSDRHEEITMRIYHLMKDRGMSQGELAERLDRSPSVIKKWLEGEHNLSLRTIAKIEDILGEDIINVPQGRSFNYDNINQNKDDSN